MTLKPELKLKNFTFNELFHSSGLLRLDQTFLTELHHHHPKWHEELVKYRAEKTQLNAQEISELLINCAIFLEQFLASFFAIEEAVAISQTKTTSFNPISAFKKYFVLRRAKKELNKVANYPSFTDLNLWLESELNKTSLRSDDKELAIALLGTDYLSQPDQQKENIEKLVQWCVRAMVEVDAQGQKLTANWTSFKVPERIDHMNLVRTVPLSADELRRVTADENQLRLRDGFKLTDERMNAREVQDEVNYCIYCHDHDGDFCSKGFPVKKGDPAQGFKKNPLDITMTGCPLEEKISEMQFLKKDGYTLASLAMVMIDNPMCPATGHRICNDCMKACIYQKQDPVNIPQIETRVLTDVLDLPWGVEIYDLLTRWNPLRQTQWIMKPYNGLKVMIAGMGPAGFTLAHHLLLEGFAVVGFDGLKIEPLSQTLVQEPVYEFKDLKESLDERLMAGFGGVAEYGITVRWDKNFLKLIYLSLMRKPHFQVFGGVRFGGTITIEDAWKMGFDHFVVAVGAGLPKALPVPGSMAPGMRQANDFLMALQLGNAAKSSSITNLQVRLPAVVIGGGLTGVDTATEVQAYYIRQVEKILERYEILVAEYGETFVQNQLDSASRDILAEYLRHGQAVRAERQRAKIEKTLPDFIKLAREWGGVTIAYRRSMQESPAYINNHEELQKALQEGIYYSTGLEPFAVELNEHGHAETLICHRRVRDAENKWVTTTEEVRLPARSILVATGTQPNTAYEFEYRGTFNRLNLQYQHYEDNDGELTVAHGVEHCKDPQFGPFTSYQKDQKRVSLIGDTHPVFHGNVVKAIASGMRSYPKIVKIFKDKMHTGDEKEYAAFVTEMKNLFCTRVASVTRRADKIVELVIQAPLAARHFQPGQFYRLQNFETYAPHIHNTLLQMEPLALVTAECDPESGMLTFLVIEGNATTKLCSVLKPGEPVSLMGPTGVRAKIPTERETVLIVGNQSSFAFVRSYARALRQAGNHVIYLGYFNHQNEVYCKEKLEDSTDAIIWLTKQGDLIKPTRPQDISLHGEDIITALLEYENYSATLGAGSLHAVSEKSREREDCFATLAMSEATHTVTRDSLSMVETSHEANKTLAPVPLKDIDRIFVVGDTTLLRRFQSARNSTLKDYLVKNPKVFGSVYGNMQCMLKGVCAQCLQWQIDPETGQRTKAVFACSWQDQPLEIIDINHIDDRQMQNRTLDTLNNLWIDHVLKKADVLRV